MIPSAVLRSVRMQRSVQPLRKKSAQWPIKERAQHSSKGMEAKWPFLLMLSAGRGEWIPLS